MHCQWHCRVRPNETQSRYVTSFPFLLKHHIRVRCIIHVKYILLWLHEYMKYFLNPKKNHLEIPHMGDLQVFICLEYLISQTDAIKVNLSPTRVIKLHVALYVTDRSRDPTWQDEHVSVQPPSRGSKTTS